MSMQIEPGVGLRLRELREKRGWSLRELSERCGLSFNAISRIERGENSPTVSSLQILATAFGIPITGFFEDTRNEAIVFVRRNRRLRSSIDGIIMESLGIGLSNQKMEPFMVTIAPNTRNDDTPIVHSGEEFVHCLEGSIIYCVGDQTYQLGAGDSLLFEATQPHMFYNPEATTARLIMVFQICEAGYSIAQRHLES